MSLFVNVSYMFAHAWLSINYSLSHILLPHCPVHRVKFDEEMSQKPLSIPLNHCQSYSRSTFAL